MTDDPFSTSACSGDSQRLLLVQPPLDRRTRRNRNRNRRRRHLVVGAVDGVEKEVSRAQLSLFLAFSFCSVESVGRRMFRLFGLGESALLQSRGRLDEMAFKAEPTGEDASFVRIGCVTNTISRAPALFGFLAPDGQVSVACPSRKIWALA